MNPNIEERNAVPTGMSAPKGCKDQAIQAKKICSRRRLHFVNRDNLRSRGSDNGRGGGKEALLLPVMMVG